MAAPDDDALIRRVAEARDQAAFSELYSRHEHAAYSLAVYLTRDAARAEEALQDAMLAVWNDAARYKPGNPRGWLLSIVAQKSIRLKQRQARSEVPMDMATQSDTAAPRDGALDGLAHREVLESLRALLEKMPDRERQLVGLYYAGGLSQDQIAETLHMPQRTVSNRLREILDGLRERLAAQGLAAAAPVLAGSAGGDLLRDAVLTGSRAPQGLAESLMTKTLSATEQSVRASAAKNSTLAWVACATVLAAGAGGVWWMQAAPEPKAETATPISDPDAEVSPPVPADAPVALSWNFSGSAPADLAPALEAWTWAERGPFARKRDKANGVMCAPVGKRVAVPLPVQLGDVPLRVRVKAASAMDEGKWMIDAIAANGTDAQALVPATEAWRPPTINIDPRKPRTIDLYFHRSYIVQVFDGKIYRQVRKFVQKPSAALTLFVVFENMAVDAVEVKSLGIDELPEPVREPEQAIQNMKDAVHGDFTEMPLEVYYPARIAP